MQSFRSSLSLFALIFVSLSCFGQSDRGAITGRVLDPSGAAVPNALVVATAVETQARYATRSEETGNFTISQLPVGKYEISVESSGFRKAVVKDISLNVAQTLSLPVTLEVGQVDQAVEVTASTVALESATSDIGTVVSSERVMDLPLAVAGNMRNPEAFIFLTPGVTGSTGDTVVNGSQTRAKEVLVDGAGATSPESGGTLFTYPSVEAVQEFKLVSSGFNAEFGRTGGGFLMFTTRSGTNELHGALFEYFRNEKFDARGFYAPTTPINKQNEFGVNLGGPIAVPKVYNGRNRSFFFFNYTGFRFRSGALNELFSLPTEAMRGGDFSALRAPNGQPLEIYDPLTTRVEGGQTVRTPFPNASIPAARFSSVAKNIIAALPPLTNSALLNNFRSVGAETFDRNQVNFRLDHNFSEKNRLSWFSYIGRQTQIGAERLPEPFTNALDRQRKSYWLRLNHDYIFSPTTLNHFIAGFTREGEYFSHLSADEGWPTKIGLKGVQTGPGNTFPRVYFTNGLTAWRDEPKTVGAQVNNAFQVNDSLTHVRGNHTYKLGLEARWLQTNGADPFNQMGTFRFNSLETALPTVAGRANTGHAWASFLLGQVNRGEYNELLVVPANRYKYFALFAQDDWKVSRRLTLNYGLRYDIYFPRTEKYGNFSGFDPGLPNPAAGNRPGAILFLGEGAGRDNSRDSLADTHYKNFGPRFGFAYSLNDRMVMRGAYGIYYSPGNAVTGLRSSQGFSLGFNAAPVFASTDNGVTPAFNWDNGFPTNWPRPPFINPAVGNGTAVNMIGREDGRPPYFQNWQFSIQRELPANMLGEVAYVGVKGTRLGSGLIRLNELDPKYLSLGALLSRPANSPEAIAAGIPLPWSGFTGSVQQALRPFPQVLDIDNRSNPNGSSTYHALQAKLERRMSNGLTYLAAYTFSRAISDNSTMAGGGIGGQTHYNRALEKAVSPNDVPHIFAFSALYELPFGPGRRWLNGGFAGKVLGGWTLTGIAQYSSGVPIILTANNTLPLFNNVLRPDVVIGEERRGEQDDFDPATDRWINPRAFSNPRSLSFGTSARSYNDLRAPASLNESVGVLKKTRLSERVELVFRAEFFNLLNRVVFAAPASNITNADFGRVSRQANTPRQGQLALRLEF